MLRRTATRRFGRPRRGVMIGGFGTTAAPVQPVSRFCRSWAAGGPRSDGATEMALRAVVRRSNSADRHLGGHAPPDRGGHVAGRTRSSSPRPQRTDQVNAPVTGLREQYPDAAATAVRYCRSQRSAGSTAQPLRCTPARRRAGRTPRWRRRVHPATADILTAERLDRSVRSHSATSREQFHERHAHFVRPS